MAFFGLFGKKKKEEIEQNTGFESGQQAPETLGMGQNEFANMSRNDVGMPENDETFSNPAMNSFNETQRSPEKIQQAQAFDKRDIELILNKLDLLNAKVENLSQRIANFERLMTTEQRRRW